MLYGHWKKLENIMQEDMTNELIHTRLQKLQRLQQNIQHQKVILTTYTNKERLWM